MNLILQISFSILDE